MKGEEFIKIYRQKEKSCDHNCSNCVVYRKDKKICAIKDLENWKKANK